MTIKTVVTLTAEDIQEQIPYALINETHSTSLWHTGKCKRAYEAHFSPKEQKLNDYLFSLSHTWYTKGVPETHSLPLHALLAWIRLGDFCASICKDAAPP